MAATDADMEKFNDLLAEYYTDKVIKKKATNRKNFEFVDGIVRDLLGDIHSSDKRFAAEPSMFGSFCQKLIVGVADEFSYAVNLVVPGPITWITAQSKNYTPRNYSFNKPPGEDLDLHGRPLADVEPLQRIPKHLKVVPSAVVLPTPGYGYGHAQVNPAGNQGSKWEDLVVEGDVIPFLAKQLLQKLLMKARSSLELSDVMEVSRNVTGSDISLTLYRGNRPLKVELTLMIQSRLPIPNGVRWPRPDTKWPSQAKAADVRMNVRATGNFYWRESFAEARTNLIMSLDKDGGQRKKVFCLLQQIIIDFCEDGHCPEPIVTPLELKNMWLWLIQSKPSGSFWTEDNIAARMLELVNMLLDAFKEKVMSHFIDQRRDLFQFREPEELDEGTKIMEKFLADPEKFLPGE